MFSVARNVGLAQISLPDMAVGGLAPSEKGKVGTRTRRWTAGLRPWSYPTTTTTVGESVGSVFEFLAAQHLRRSPAAPHAPAGDRMRRLEADGHVTRFVTRMLCHVVILSGNAETVASSGGLVTWDVGVWVGTV
jgi:hypothetical protein